MILDFVAGAVVGELVHRIDQERGASSVSTEAAGKSAAAKGTSSVAVETYGDHSSSGGTGSASGTGDDKRPGLVADVIFLVLFVLLAFVPALGYRTNYEAFFQHGLVPLFALVLWGSSHGGVVSKALSHPTLTGLGDISFHVYLSQRPVYDAFTWASGLNTHNSASFMAYLLCLYAWAQVYATYVDEPYAAWLKAATFGTSSSRGSTESSQLLPGGLAN